MEFLGASQASAVAGNAVHALTTGADLFEGHHSHSQFQCKTLLSLTVSLLHLMLSGLGKKLAWK